MGKKDPRKILSDLRDYVYQYREISALIDGRSELFVPTVQIRGLLLELAMKTYLAGNGAYEEGHNLSTLAQRCTEFGFTFTKRDRDDVIDRLNERYNYDGAHQWWYGSRYPMEDRPTTIWIVPSHESVDDLIGRLVKPTS